MFMVASQPQVVQSPNRRPITRLDLFLLLRISYYFYYFVFYLYPLLTNDHQKIISLNPKELKSKICKN